MRQRAESGIIVTSITYAMRGREVLLRNGIHATAERISPAVSGCGCGYGLRVRADGLVAARLLQDASIKVKGFYEPI